MAEVVSAPVPCQYLGFINVGCICHTTFTIIAGGCSFPATQWLQFDVGPPTLVTGLITKGRGDGKRKQWVTRFRLSFSNDTQVWYYYKDASHLDPKVTFDFQMTLDPKVNLDLKVTSSSVGGHPSSKINPFSSQLSRKASALPYFVLPDLDWAFRHLS